ncbi:CAMK family protein kinase [Tritrichomonas foetus]|uniref:CAMK family protein kinase n=1 Tax=Tritrichomonas foetus TaxID=1144522 RepID=A0A1J4JVP7_9EUKA|nr:CAMK family protein kinase [Tritrichomonas foetus]|eukprot:OHT02504.1 CAMK family protein kinase [Tritrichomonas foetus]
MTEQPPAVPEILHRTSRDGTKISYTIENRMGSGGFAVVYSGEELPSHRPIAIKCIPKTRIQDPRVKEKLISEVEIHRSLHHPNVVEFRGVFQDDNYVYILLELCPNGTVLDQLKKHMPFDEETAANVARQVLEALVYLHKKRVIHRDLKLQNFLLGDDNILKVADFGLSAQLEDDDDKRMTICGTPGYLSPEVIDHQDGQTYSVDIWATGVCTFLMLTGRQPFQSKDKHQTYRKIKQVNYRWPDEPKISDIARNFVDSALQRDPSLRPNAEALLQHPFILRNQKATEIPRSVSSPAPIPRQVSSAGVPGLHLPSYAVRIWWDYSHRYGLAYLLHNHITGACFNDASRILMTPDETLAQYWDSPQTPQPEIISMRAMENSPIKKKLLLIKHFASELKSRAGEMIFPPLKLNLPTDVIAHVKYWARTKDGVLFRMANRDIQANFRDHTKLVIESQSKKLFFDQGGGGVIQLALSDLNDRDKHPEVRKRFSLVKEMAKHLV